MRTTATVAYKAARIFKDYVIDLYYPLHQLSWFERLRTGPLLFAVEHMVYQVDSITEDIQDVGLGVGDGNYSRLQRYKDKLEAFLRSVGAHDDAVAHHLEMGKQYVLLENRVTASRTFSRTDVVQLAELRPSDVRLLHSIMVKILGRADGADLLALTWPVEVLADIGNDLAHYRDDVAHNRFNTYAAFVELYDTKAGDRLCAAMEHYEELFLTELEKFPAAGRDRLRTTCARRYRAQTAVIPEALPQLGYLSPEPDTP